jgi:hypothetical protein
VRTETPRSLLAARTSGVVSVRDEVRVVA